MVFSSAIFLLLFLPIVFLINLILPNKCSNVFLLFASLFFYAWGEPKFVVVMILVIVLSWFIGLMLERTKHRKCLLGVGVCLILMVLLYYKYFNFLASILNRVARRNVISVAEIALPIGISFFTFQAISYLIDVYRKETEASRNIVNTALYISFFPQLIAGPIVKYKDIDQQIRNRKLHWLEVSHGFKRFIYGLAKKVLISNTLGLCVDNIYTFEISRIDWKAAWICSLAYTFQIYYDFSGYSDMAIGLGKMFGFNIPENFNYPYLSKSITEFWRRWHISLGAWFKDYVYIPLGGNRISVRRTYVNLFIVFLVTGIWHGAGYTFIAWGIYHGIFILIERGGLKKLLDKSKLVSTVYCFLIVNIGWVLFRSPGFLHALALIKRMVMPWKFASNGMPFWHYMDMKIITVGFLAILGGGIIKRFTPKKLAEAWNDSVVEAIYCVLLLILCVAAVAANTYNPFIYFQF